MYMGNKSFQTATRIVVCCYGEGTEKQLFNLFINKLGSSVVYICDCQRGKPITLEFKILI
jgi:hypothetical protein